MPLPVNQSCGVRKAWTSFTKWWVSSISISLSLHSHSYTHTHLHSYSHTHTHIPTHSLSVSLWYPLSVCSFANHSWCVRLSNLIYVNVRVSSTDYWSSGSYMYIYSYRIMDTFWVLKWAVFKIHTRSWYCHGNVSVTTILSTFLQQLQLLNSGFFII